MKKEKKILKSIGIIIGVLALLSSAGEARTYTRACSAYYFAEPIDMSHGRGARLPGNTTFTGRGTVSYYAPNLARKRARRHIVACAEAHWRTRRGRAIPRECTADRQIYNYDLRYIEASLANRLCTVNPGHRSIRAQVGVWITGKKGCEKRIPGVGIIDPEVEMLTSSIRFTCPR